MTEESIYRVAMDEAAHYEGSDEDEWEVVQAPPSAPVATKRKLRNMISIRVAPEELDSIKAAADKEKLSVSAFVRVAALSFAMPNVARFARMTSNNSNRIVRMNTSSARNYADSEFDEAIGSRFELLTS